MPELLEISGLDDDVGQVINHGPHFPEFGPPDTISFGVMAMLIVYGIGRIASSLRGKTLAAGGEAIPLGDLGVIRRCRSCDLTSKKPKSQQKWCLWTQAETRILGRHPTKERALRQERLIQMRKHRG